MPTIMLIVVKIRQLEKCRKLEEKKHFGKCWVFTDPSHLGGEAWVRNMRTHVAPPTFQDDAAAMRMLIVAKQTTKKGRKRERKRAKAMAVLKVGESVCPGESEGRAKQDKNRPFKIMVVF